MFGGAGGSRMRKTRTYKRQTRKIGEGEGRGLGNSQGIGV